MNVANIPVTKISVQRAEGRIIEANKKSKTLSYAQRTYNATGVGGGG